MTRRLSVLLVTFLVVGLLLPLLGPTPTSAMTGSGTPGDPYLIYDVDDLQDISLDTSAYYELANDIDASATSGWNGGLGFAPIEGFTGSLNGSGYSITGLFVNRSGGNFGLTGGLFGSITGATIQNLLLYDANITITTSGTSAPCNVGILVGYMVGGTISRVYVNGTVTAVITDTSTPRANGDCGGLVGQAINTLAISECASDASVYSYGYDVGVANAGGLVGVYQNGAGTGIINSYASGLVWASCAAFASAGGLVGTHVTSGVIDNCYSIGSVTSTASPGGLVGVGDISTTDSFWDTQTSGQATSAGGTGKTTSQMKTLSTFTGTGWDFDDIWGMDLIMNGGYPYLLWECTAVYSLTTSSTAGGDVTVPGEGVYDYCEGAVVNLTAVPELLYCFAGWSGDVSTVDDITSLSTTVTMNGDYEIEAVFVDDWNLTISSTDGGNVTTPGEGTFYYDDDVVVSLNVTPDSGYAFYRWTGSASAMASMGNRYSGSTNITLNASYSILANFQSNSLLPMPVLPIITPDDEEVDPSILPWYSLIHPAAVGLGWRTIDLWSLLIIFIAIAMGVGVMIATGSTLLAAVTVAIVLVVGVSMSVLSLWVVIVYAIFSGSYLIAVRSM